LDAIRKMRVALEEMYIEGIDTNTDLHDKIFHEKNFVEGNISINYLKEILNIS
jgi:acetyl-CoA carboxylase biotin carboxylase subunit